MTNPLTDNELGWALTLGRMGMKDRDQLMQEDYVDTEHGPWKVLVICQCLNQATWMVAERVVRGLFEKYPRPDDLDLIKRTYLQGTELMDDLYERLRPLGFGKRRADNMVRMSMDYVMERMKWGPRLERYDIARLQGCGQYAVDAWHLFVLKNPVSPQDRRLREYAESHGLIQK